MDQIAKPGKCESGQQGMKTEGGSAIAIKQLKGVKGVEKNWWEIQEEGGKKGSKAVEGRGEFVSRKRGSKQ